MAVGGEGVPVPYADCVLFRDERLCRTVQNIGGIANLTFLPVGGGVPNAIPASAGMTPPRRRGRIGGRKGDACVARTVRRYSLCPDGHTTNDILAFDTGPGNMVIDGMMRLVTKGRCQYDRNGVMAAEGEVHEGLLKEMLRHPFLWRRPPSLRAGSSSGSNTARGSTIRPVERACCRRTWSRRRPRLPRRPSPWLIAGFCRGCRTSMILCGGGAHNATLVRMLQHGSRR